jgi:hypothetical protein
MPLSVDEVSAEVSTPENRTQPAGRTEPQPPTPSEIRRQREQIERMEKRRARIRAD